MQVSEARIRAVNFARFEAVAGETVDIVVGRCGGSRWCSCEAGAACRRNPGGRADKIRVGVQAFVASAPVGFRKAARV